MNTSGYISSASTNLGADDSRRAFDNVIDANCWHSNASSGNWLQIQFPTARVVTNVSLRTRYNYSDMSMRGRVSYVFAGSNDGTNWTTLGTFTDNTSGQMNTVFAHDVTNTTAYTYYRMTFSQNSSYCVVSECILLGY